MENSKSLREGKERKSGQIIRIEQEQLTRHLDKVVRGTVEETLNALLDAEADRLCQASRYERTEKRKDTRAGHYKRNLDTKAGQVQLKVPKLRTLSFETAIIERYRRREEFGGRSAHGDVPGGRVGSAGGRHHRSAVGDRVSPGTVSNLNKKVYERIEKWINSRIEGEYPYVFLDGIWLKRCWAGEVKNVSILVAIGVDQNGYRHVLGVQEGAKEDKESWMRFLRHLKSRGLQGVRLFVSDKCLGLVESLADFYPQVQWQRCVVHFYRNVFTAVPKGRVKEVAAMLKAIHAQEDRQAAEEKIVAVLKKLKNMKLTHAAKIVEEGGKETLSYYDFPSQHWRSIRTNNPLERLMREIRRRTRVVGAFPDGQSALMLVAARLRHVAATRWGTRQYLNMERLTENIVEMA
jgi:transposase-like protein